MGDIELYLRAKHSKLNGNSNASSLKPNNLMLYTRDATLTDEENALLNRFYCGNPFIAPGTLGAKGSKRNYFGLSLLSG